MLRLFSTSAMIDAIFSAVWNLSRHVRPGKNAEPFVSIFCKPLNLHRSTLARMRKVELRARFERSPLGTYTSLGSQDTFNEGVTRGSVRCAQKRNCSRVRVPCRDRSTSPAVYVRVISWRVRFQNGLLVILACI